MSGILSGIENLVGIPTAQSKQASAANTAATNYYGQLGANASTDSAAFNANVNPLLAAYTNAAGLPNLPGVPGAAAPAGGGAGTANGQSANGPTAGNATGGGTNPQGSGPVASNPYQLTQAQSQELLQQKTQVMTSTNNAINNFKAQMAQQGYQANSPEVAESIMQMQQQAANQQAALESSFTATAQTNAQNSAAQMLQFFSGLQSAGQSGLGAAAQGSQALAATAQEQVNQSENLVAGLGGAALTGFFNNLFGGGSPGAATGGSSVTPGASTFPADGSASTLGPSDSANGFLSNLGQWLGQQG